MHVCQRCRGNLKTCDGEIPSSSFDLTVACAEQHAYQNASGTLITPIRPTVFHYHCRAECIKAAEPNFIPSGVCIPEAMYCP